MDHICGGFSDRNLISFVILRGRRSKPVKSNITTKVIESLVDGWSERRHYLSLKIVSAFPGLAFSKCTIPVYCVLKLLLNDNNNKMNWFNSVGITSSNISKSSRTAWGGEMLFFKSNIYSHIPGSLFSLKCSNIALLSSLNGKSIFSGYWLSLDHIRTWFYHSVNTSPFIRIFFLYKHS